MTSRRVPLLVLAVALAGALGAAARPARAQVRGVVVDTAGRPLPGVLVELWDAHRRLAGDGTDARGQFRLAAAGSGPRALLARGIGLEPLRHLLAPGDSIVRLRMRPRAIELAAVYVEASRSGCTSADDPRARAVWEHAARHYDVALSAYGVHTDVQLFAALVAADSVGVIDTTLLQETAVGGGYSSLAYATRLMTQSDFYAVPASSQAPWRRYGHWIHPLLESSRAWHFADSLFGMMNRLTFVEATAGDTVIAFCSGLADRPYIRGRLRLAPDTTLASAEWEYVTPPPREEAGGVVLFAPADGHATGQPILPVAGLFWRRVPGGVYQEWMEFRRWYRCESADHCARPTPFAAAAPAATAPRQAPGHDPAGDAAVGARPDTAGRTPPQAERTRVRGVVTDPAGRPLPGVLVELWDTFRRLSGVGTDASGEFRFGDAGSGPRALLLRAIGLEPLRRSLAPRDSVLRLVMQPHAVELAAVTVETVPTDCPDADDPLARALWEHAASHYDVGLSAYGVRSDIQMFSALVPADSIGLIDTTRLQAWATGGGYSPLAFDTRFATQANFYAVPSSSRVPWRRFGRWNYPLLESSRAWHFGDSLFAVMNRLSMEVLPDGDTAIAFCSSQDDRPYIRGRLRLGPDTTLASAQWEFVTPRPREEAGGQVLFAPTDGRARRQPLLPVAGLFWRRLLTRVYQEWMEFREWYRCESAVSCVAPTPLR